MKQLLSLLFISFFVTTVGQSQAQEVGTTTHNRSLSITSPAQLEFVDPMTLVEQNLFCGGKETQGTPIAGNACGADGDCTTVADNGNSGNINIVGIPITATVVKATLYWTVLTNSDEASNTGQNISFNGNPIAGTKIGFSLGRTPCFPQANTFAWKADVSALVPSPGNGMYTVSGFPGGNQISGNDFTEGASLHVVFSEASSPLVDLSVYEGLAVTNAVGDTFTQTLTGFQANPSGPVSATWFPVIGNGQIAPETITFDGSLASIDFSNDALLDGGTSAFPPASCSYTDDATNVQCYWDDDKPNVSAAIANGDTSATVNYTLTNDCHSFVGMQMVVSTGADAVCSAGGDVVDAACPPGATYRNHGAYVSCVAHAAEAFLAQAVLSCINSAELEEIQSCIVNPRARSSVGK